MSLLRKGNSSLTSTIRKVTHANLSQSAVRENAIRTTAVGLIDQIAKNKSSSRKPFSFGDLFPVAKALGNQTFHQVQNGGQIDREVYDNYES